MYYKNLLKIMIGLMLLALMTACGGASGQPAAGVESYKIGAFYSITGGASSLGVPERDTALMVAEQINKNGGVKGPDGKMHLLELIIEDDKSDASAGVLAVKKLIEEKKVSVVIGGTSSGGSAAVLDTIAAAKVPFISHAAASNIVEPVDQRTWVFKTAPMTRLVSQIQVDWLKAKGFTKIASFGGNNGFGSDSMKAFNEVAAPAGIQLVWEGTYEPNDTDFAAQLTKISGSGAQALLVHGTPAEAAPLTVQARDMGLTIPIVHNHGIANQTFIDLAGKAADGVLFPVGKLMVAQGLPDSDPQKAVLLQYTADYGQYSKGKKPSTFGGHAWDALNLVKMAFEKAGPNPAGIRDALEGTQNFAGVSGVFNMSAKDHNGITKEAMVMVLIKDGVWTYVAPADYKNVP